jgi:hypothetical protein
LATTAGCGPDDAGTSVEPKARPIEEVVPLDLTPLERAARQRLDARHADAQKAERLAGLVKKAMTAYLFDPASAQFTSLRQGRNGAVCGKYNAKNRYGAYTGYKDFVLSRDGETIFGSDRNDGVRAGLLGGFAEAYVNACATDKEIKAYREATSFESEDEPSAEDPFVDL